MVLHRNQADAIFQSGGLQHRGNTDRGVVQVMPGLPAQGGHLADRLRGELRRRDVDEGVGPRRLQRDNLRVHRRVSDLVGGLGHDHAAGPGAQPCLEAVQVVLAVVVVLVEQRDPGVRPVLQNVQRVQFAFPSVAGIDAHRPGKVLRIVPLRRAAPHEEVRHLLLVHVSVDRRVACGADGVGCEQHAVLLDQPADHFNGLGRAVAIVKADEVDPAPVDAALLVEHPEVREFYPADGAVGRCRAAVRHRLADLDLGVCRTTVISLLTERGHGDEGGAKCEEAAFADGHG